MIDLYVLAEELGGRVVPGTTHPVERLDLSSVRLFSAEAAGLERGCVYIIDVSDLQRVSAEADGFCLAIANLTYPVDGELPVSALVLPETYSVLSALDAVQRVFERYQRLADKAIRLAIDGTGIESILPVFSDVLVNPIALFDAAFVFIGATSIPAEDERDDTWNEVLAKAHLTSGAFRRQPSEALRQSQLDILRGRLEPSTFDYEGAKAFTTSIIWKDETVAIMAATDVYGPFSQGQLSIILWIRQLLEELWPDIARNLERGGTSDQVLVQVLNRTPVAEHLVLPYLARRFWNADDRYRLLLVYRPGTESLSMAERAAARQELATLFRDAGILVLDEGVAAVLHAARDFEELGGEQLATMLGCRRLRGAASDVVHSFYDLGAAFSQCRAVRAMDTGADEHPVTSFDDACEGYVLRVLSEGEHLDTFCLPGVRELLSRQNGMELVHSLRVYVMNGRNMSSAARELYVHRNTLSYRLEQAERLCGLTLDELDEAGLFRLYLTCLILEERGAGDGTDPGIR